MVITFILSLPSFWLISDSICASRKWLYIWPLQIKEGHEDVVINVSRFWALIKEKEIVENYVNLSNPAFCWDYGYALKDDDLEEFIEFDKEDEEYVHLLEEID